MKRQRLQTTYTFNTRQAATMFMNWLKRHENDRDYGCPKYVDLRDVGNYGTCVEYSYETDFARGFATGIEYAANANNGGD